MKKIISASQLKERIAALEAKQRYQGALLKEQIKTTYENLNPIHLIKNTLSDLPATSDVKEGLLKTTLGIAAGYLSKKIVVGSATNSFKQMLGAMLQIGVTYFVSKNVTTIKNVATDLFHSAFKEKEKTEEESV